MFRDGPLWALDEFPLSIKTFSRIRGPALHRLLDSFEIRAIGVMRLIRAQIYFQMPGWLHDGLITSANEGFPIRERK
jgi:hypothetical protein